MTSAGWKKRAGALLLAGLVLAGGIWMSVVFVRKRRVYAVSSKVPAQTAEELLNPDCGVCPLVGWTMGEDASQMPAKLNMCGNVSLILVEINLKNYRNGAIDEAALKTLDTFLEQSASPSRRLILRFLYDADGMAALTEPDSIETILTHMRQVGPLLAEHADSIYTLQGLFTGNWGEMNGSRFADADSLRRLYTCLREATEGKVRLAVRTPAQWRTILQSDVTDELAEASGLGLFNDGMTGSETDYGTYAGGKAESEPDLTDPWPRERELAFQEQLCRIEPNGGEAIHPCVWNDLSQAVSSMSQMHVSYLNPDYDPAVWDKWKQTTVSEEGVFYGTNGADYICSHLGYRYVVTGSDVTYGWWRNQLHVSLEFRNIGFAPVYESVTPVLTLRSSEGEEICAVVMTGDLSSLPGGTDREREMILQADLPAEGLTTGTYALELSVRYGEKQLLALGNIPDGAGSYVYTIGNVTAQ